MPAPLRMAKRRRRSRRVGDAPNSVDSLWQWKVIVHDRYPAYVTWETFARIAAILDDNYAAYEHNRRRGVPRHGAALLQGIVYCGRCGHKMMVQYKGGNEYLCNYLRGQTQAPVCQRLPADPVDQQVVAAFFEAWPRPNSTSMITPSPNAVSSSRRSTRPNGTPCNAWSMRQTGHAIATSRSIPPTDWSPRNWSSGGKPPCRPYKKAQAQYTRARQAPGDALRRTISPALRETFSTVGQALPTLWRQDTLSRAQRKALLRCLIEKVVVDRQVPDTIATRLVWRGGAVSELAVPCTVGTLRDVTGFAQMEAQILRLEAQGHSDEAIAERLTSPGFARPSGRGCWPARSKRFACGTDVCIVTAAPAPGACRVPHRVAAGHGPGGQSPLDVPSDQPRPDQRRTG